MKVLVSNAIASIQDLGRFGYRSLGVGKNGAMDTWSLQAGNALVKNPLDMPALEITMGSMTIEFEQDVSFCLTGGLYEAYLDDKRVAGYWRINAKAGQVLKLVRPVQGMYTYFCVHGGFTLSAILGSYSTNAKAEFGGYEGRFLKADDTITINTSAALDIIGIAPIKATNRIRIVKSSEYDNFTKVSQELLTSQPWKIETSSNRMGYRFKGATPLALNEPLQMNSHGVDIGMIQVPPQGQPIVLMADSQTTGGYPKIATVIEADIGLLAQTRYGKECEFELVDIADAIKARSDRQYYIEQIKEYANAN